MSAMSTLKLGPGGLRMLRAALEVYEPEREDLRSIIERDAVMTWLDHRMRVAELMQTEEDEYCHEYPDGDGRCIQCSVSVEGCTADFP